MVSSVYRKTNFSQRSGISKVGLLIVLGIVIVVLGITIQATKVIRDRNNRKQCIINLARIYKGMESYAKDNEGKIPTRLEKSGKKIWANLLGSDWNPYGLGHLIKGRYIEDPKVFYCPVNTMVRFEQQYWFSTKGAESWMTYRYRNNNSAGHPARWAEIYVPTKIDETGRAILADEPYLDWHKHAHKTGYNVLYLGGNVNWVDDSKEEIQGDLYKAWELFDGASQDLRKAE